jgi:voltage-gated potassium channel
VIVFIFVATFSFVLQTMDQFDPDKEGNEDWVVIWSVVDHICFATFTADWLLRWWGAAVLGEGSSFVCGAMNIVDLMSIIPFYMNHFVDVMDSKFLRVLRLTRITALLKSARFGKVGDIVVMILSSSIAPMMIPLFFMSLGSIVISCIMYYLEYEKTSDKEEAMAQTFYSIPAALWWSMVTFTTVGYGDLYPVTPAGQLLCAFTMFMGVFFMAMPVAIVGNSFQQTWEMIQRQVRIGHPSVSSWFML